eukprot:8285917-Pyramimonas_sp.AAC.1
MSRSATLWMESACATLSPRARIIASRRQLLSATAAPHGSSTSLAQVRTRSRCMSSHVRPSHGNTASALSPPSAAAESPFVGGGLGLQHNYRLHGLPRPCGCLFDFIEKICKRCSASSR